MSHASLMDFCEKIERALAENKFAENNLLEFLMNEMEKENFYAGIDVSLCGKGAYKLKISNAFEEIWIPQSGVLELRKKIK